MSGWEIALIAGMLVVVGLAFRGLMPGGRFKASAKDNWQQRGASTAGASAGFVVGEHGHDCGDGGSGDSGGGADGGGGN